MKRTVRSNVGEVTVRESGFVMVKVFSGAEINIQEAIEYHSMVAYSCGDEPHVTVIDLTGLKYISKESREYLSKTSSEWGKTIAVALVTNSFASRMIGNFFLSVNKPSYPIKIFRDSLEAYSWAQNEYFKSRSRIAS